MHATAYFALRTRFSLICIDVAYDDFRATQRSSRFCLSIQLFIAGYQAHNNTQYIVALSGAGLNGPSAKNLTSRLSSCISRQLTGCDTRED